MIGSLQGFVEVRRDPYIILTVNGVGYKILASRDVLASISSEQKEIKIYTYTHVREDALELFGFSTLQDLDLFEMLLSVSGIGPKTALSIFSVGNKDQIVQAIQTANVAFFQQVPRLGSKNAQKIIIELKSKVGGVGEIDLSGATQNSEIFAALKTFGFSQKEIADALVAISEKGTMPTDTNSQIKLALKYLGK